MDIRYVAGFFDGEGCIFFRGQGPSEKRHGQYGIYISFVQSHKQDQVLKEIQAFLIQRGVKARFRTRYKAYIPGGNPMSIVEVGDQRCVKAILTSMLPYLIVKREKAERAIAQIRTRQRERRLRYGRVPPYKIEIAKSLYLKGWSLKRIVKRIGFCRCTLSKLLRASGVEMASGRCAWDRLPIYMKRRIIAKLRRGVKKSHESRLAKYTKEDFRRWAIIANYGKGDVALRKCRGCGKELSIHNLSGFCTPCQKAHNMYVLERMYPLTTKDSQTL